MLNFFLLQTNQNEKKRLLIKIKLTWRQAICELLLGHIQQMNSPYANGQLQNKITTNCLFSQSHCLNSTYWMCVVGVCTSINDMEAIIKDIYSRSFLICVCVCLSCVCVRVCCWTFSDPRSDHFSSHGSRLRVLIFVFWAPNVVVIVH